MESLLEFVRGPLFRLTFAFMVVGLLRHLGLFLWGMIQTLRRTERSVPPFAGTIRKLATVTLRWFVPLSHFKIHRTFTAVSYLFHFGLIITPVFLFEHNQLWRKGVGVGLPAINARTADILTIAVIITAAALLGYRLADRDKRFLSRPQDFLILPILIVPFLSGYLAMHPSLNPVPYSATMLVHVLSAELVFVLIPTTKITHCVLYPFAHFASSYAWRFVPTGGEDVHASLGKEGRV